MRAPLAARSAGSPSRTTTATACRRSSSPPAPGPTPPGSAPPSCAEDGRSGGRRGSLPPRVARRLTREVYSPPLVRKTAGGAGAPGFKLTACAAARAASVGPFRSAPAARRGLHPGVRRRARLSRRSAHAGVRLGDAVPGVIKGSDLERIREAARHQHFSVVRRSGSAPRRARAILVEPLTEKPLAMLRRMQPPEPSAPTASASSARRSGNRPAPEQRCPALLSIDQETAGHAGASPICATSGARSARRLERAGAEAAFGHVALVLSRSSRDRRTCAARRDRPFRIE